MKPVTPLTYIETCQPGENSQVIQPGDFFLVHGDNFFSRLIQFGQSLRFRGKSRHFAYWTHAGIFTSQDGNIIEALSQGVVERNINYYRDYKYIIIHIQASDADRVEMINFVKSCLGDGYGWTTILSIAFSLLMGLKFSFGFTGQEICSGLVCRALERTSFIPKNDASHTAPADLAQAFDVQ